MSKGLPEIWTGEYSSWDEWRAALPSIEQNAEVRGRLDDLQISRSTAFRLPAFCSCCDSPQNMVFDWSLTQAGPGMLHIAWTEKLVCDGCGMNSRMRALWEYAVSKLKLDQQSTVYLPEQITPGFQKWHQRFPRAIGSEFISKDTTPGSLHVIAGSEAVRHEDLTGLSFENECINLIVSQDVFEHIPDYKKALGECFRVLRQGGTLLFSIPFFPLLSETDVRVRLNSTGGLESDYPLEFHGNPMSSEGSLCFQHFGWDLLDDLRAVGFSQATAHSYWSPANGHLGSTFFVFSAVKQNFAHSAT